MLPPGVPGAAGPRDERRRAREEVPPSFPGFHPHRNLSLATRPGAMARRGRLRRRPAKVTSLLVIAHSAGGIAFNLGGDAGGDTKPLHIFSVEAIDMLCKKDGLVDWTPGLLQLSEETVDDPVFV